MSFFLFYQHIQLLSRLLSFKPCCSHDACTPSSRIARVSSVPCWTRDVSFGRCFRTSLSRIICFFFCRNLQLASSNVRDMYWICRLRNDYSPVLRFIFVCPILCPDIYPHDDPSDEGTMTTACPPLSLIISPCLVLSSDCCLRPCCHIFQPS